MKQRPDSSIKKLQMKFLFKLSKQLTIPLFIIYFVKKINISANGRKQKQKQLETANIYFNEGLEGQLRLILHFKQKINIKALQFIHMIKIGFKGIQLFSLVLLALVFSVQSDRFNISVTCQPCKMSCGVANCYRIASARFDYENCPTVSCDTSLNRVIAVDKCAYDYDGSTCSSNVCFYPYTNAGCASRKLNISQCTSSLQNLQFSCGSCASGSTCQNCFRLQTTASNSELSNQCLGSTCNGVLSTNTVASYSTCIVDIFGYPCTCCMNLINYGYNMFGQCINNFPQFIGGGFVAYAQNRTAYNSSATNFEYVTIFNIAVMLLVAMLM